MSSGNLRLAFRKNRSFGGIYHHGDKSQLATAFFIVTAAKSQILHYEYLLLSFELHIEGTELKIISHFVL
jgi:hypothetical protein